MAIWKALFFEPGALAADAAQSTEWNRGAYLVEGLGHCSMCHTPRGWLGATDTDLAMTGGTYMTRVEGKLDRGEIDRRWDDRHGRS